MLNDNVKRNNALPKNINIIAFGIGVERIAMLKYKINDIRKFYEE
jgi:phenylalanyl-tRNA synthetase alpha chain